MEFLEITLHSFVNLAMLLFEYIGVGVITFAGIQGIVNYIKREPDTRLVLAQGLAMGLEFKLGSEILRTVVVRSLSEIAIVGSIIALRAVLTILIHWEIKNEESERKISESANEESSQETAEAAIKENSRETAEAAIKESSQETAEAAIKENSQETAETAEDNAKSE